MFKKLYYSICCLLLASGFAGATEQQFYDVGKDELLEDKYEGYKTTLSESFRGAFSSETELYQDVRDSDISTRNYSFSGGNAGLGGYQNQYRDLFGQRELDFGGNHFESMTQGFQSEFSNMFARDDSLVKEFSVPQPRYFNQGFASQNNSGGTQNSPASGAGGNKSNHKPVSSSYEYVEQPTIISWVFGTIAYVREHPVITGIIVLVIFSIISLIQAMVQAKGKPFVPEQSNSYERRHHRSHSRGRGR